MYCQSTNNLPGGVTPAFCASRSWFRLPNPSLRPAGFGLSSVDPAPEQVSSSRRATSLLPSASNVLSKYLRFVWGKSLFVFTAKCHLLYCEVLSCEITLVTVSKYLLGSASWFLSRSYFCLSNLLALLLTFHHTSIFIQDCISAEDL